MDSTWGNNGQGPGDDQSWLGGKDRGGSGPSGSDPSGSGSSGTGWSSDFGDSGPASGATDQRATDQHGPDQQGPVFGDRSGQDGSSRPEGNGSGWASSFTGASDSGSSRPGSGKGTAAVLIGALSSVVGIVIFAVIAYKMGLDLWWVVLFVGIPLLRRVGRLLGRSTRR